MKRLLPMVLAAGCTSHTAQIAASANDVRAAATLARKHLDAVDRQLEVVESAAAEVHQQIGYVSDDASPVVEALRYGSYIALAAVAGGAIYLIKTKF